MPRDKTGAVRKVFMLPVDLVERIAAFQSDAGLPSEVEAVRRLLDDALRFRDDWHSLTNRFRNELAERRVLADAAKEVLVGHPLVASLTFNRNSLTFSMTTGETITASGSGEISCRDAADREFFQAPAFELGSDGSVTNPDLPF